jgi:hypothetical protein
MSVWLRNPEHSAAVESECRCVSPLRDVIVVDCTELCSRSFLGRTSVVVPTNSEDGAGRFHWQNAAGNYSVATRLCTVQAIGKQKGPFPQLLKPQLAPLCLYANTNLYGHLFTTLTLHDPPEYSQSTCVRLLA